MARKISKRKIMGRFSIHQKSSLPGNFSGNLLFPQNWSKLWEKSPIMHSPGMLPAKSPNCCQTGETFSARGIP
jgi:hypothetical protein